jgi:hypothetical protein
MNGLFLQQYCVPMGRRRNNQGSVGAHGPKVHFGPSRDDEHEIKYFRRHEDDDPDQAAPGRAFLNGCDAGVRAKFRATLVAVAAAPPHRFAGGDY